METRMILRRSPGSYIVTIVFPSFVIVALSWSSFFVPVNLLAVKLSIALTTAMSSLIMHILCRSVLAPVLKSASYVTLIDIWLTSCLLFVLSALIVQLIVVSRAADQQQLQVRYEVKK